MADGCHLGFWKHIHNFAKDEGFGSIFYIGTKTKIANKIGCRGQLCHLPKTKWRRPPSWIWKNGYNFA